MSTRKSSAASSSTSGGRSAMASSWHVRRFAGALKKAEHELVVWINELRGEGVPISAIMLHLQALEVAAAHEVPGFRASWSWMKRFKARNKLSMRARTRQGQISPEDLDKIAADFSKEVAQKVQDLGIKTVYNADQTGIVIAFYILYC
ncbi:unnamed protein product [Phytophthora lilii]|uniref:Unnamed protein product n=1 Tax=Phytophthora lilii TaxID=2077276 RepID=A0A9W6WM85_9STRA|nr:unnamed protein product [Phytophthora lilii]